MRAYAIPKRLACLEGNHLNELKHPKDKRMQSAIERGKKKKCETGKNPKLDSIFRGLRSATKSIH